MSGRLRVRRAASCVSCALGTELAMLELDSGTYYSVNGTGARIWKWLEAAPRIDELRERMARHYALAPEVLDGHLRIFLGKLEDAGLACIEQS